MTAAPNPQQSHPQSIDAVLRSITAEISSSPELGISSSRELGATSTPAASSVSSMPSWSAVAPSPAVSSLKGWGFGDAYADTGDGGDGDLAWLDSGGSDGLQARRRLRETMRAATALAEEATALPTCAGVLCLDEVQVTDIADASIVRGLVGPTPGTPTPTFYPHPLPPTPIPQTRWTTS